MKLTQHGTHRTSQSWSVSMCFVFSTYSAKKRSYLQIARIHRIHRMSCNITSQHITILTILRMVETSAMENTVFHSKISSDQVGSRYKGPMCPIWVVCAEASWGDKWHNVLQHIVLGSWKSSYDSSTHGYWKTWKGELGWAGLLIPGSLRICRCNM